MIRHAERFDLESSEDSSQVLLTGMAEGRPTAWEGNWKYFNRLASITALFRDAGKPPRKSTEQ
jgi:hypothetical protein